MENASLPNDVWDNVTTSSSYVTSYVSYAPDLVLRIIYVIIGTVGVLDNVCRRHWQLVRHHHLRLLYQDRWQGTVSLFCNVWHTCESEVVPYPITSVWADPGFLAVSLHVTLVINPVAGCRYFLPGPRLLFQPKRSPPWLVTNYTAWWQKHTDVSSLPKATTQWCPARTRARDLRIRCPASGATASPIASIIAPYCVEFISIY